MQYNQNFNVDQTARERLSRALRIDAMRESGATQSDCFAHDSGDGFVVNLEKLKQIINDAVKEYLSESDGKEVTVEDLAPPVTNKIRNQLKIYNVEIPNSETEWIAFYSAYVIQQAINTYNEELEQERIARIDCERAELKDIYQAAEKYMALKNLTGLHFTADSWGRVEVTEEKNRR